jgi:hypothetical protein
VGEENHASGNENKKKRNKEEVNKNRGSAGEEREPRNNGWFGETTRSTFGVALVDQD